MTKFRAPAALVMVLGLCGWGVGPARGQDRLVIGDKVERTQVEPVEADWTEVDPDAGTEIHLELPARVTAGISPDCNVIGGFFVTFPGANRFRGNVYRVTANARLNQIHMELAYDDPVNFVASVHRKNPDGTYTQIGLDIQVPTQTGGGAAGAPAFVDSVVIDPPIALEAGFDYAIGFSWGAANMVYARDSVAHPVNFEIGRVLGSAAVNGLIGEPPAVPDTFGNLTIFTGGSYSMLLCLEPEPGACCNASLAVPACENVFESQCSGAGSFFRGERTTCAETVCNFGACCGPCGTCDNGVAAGACTARPDGVGWSGVTCPASPELLCPVTSGACCSSNGTCTETCQALCNGTFRGVGTSCEPNICKGACCISSSGCSERTQTSCMQFLGQFRGLGTTCDTLPPQLQCRIGGACCFGETSLTFCANVAQREFCSFDAFPVTAYRGDGTTCATSTCGTISGYQACCLPDGTCVNLNATAPGPDTCTAIGVHGEYNAGVRCEEFANGCPTEAACCLPNGTCDTLTTAGCTAKEGSRPGTATCAINSCPIGACCDSNDGSCVVETQAACVANGGTYRGNATDCNVLAEICPGYGSCCREDGECFDDETAARCGTIGGAYQSDGSTCDAPVVDCDERGACCATTGTCLFVTAAECRQVGGAFRGAGVACAASTCPMGACCFGESCAIRTQDGCDAELGNYLGDSTSCTAGICVPGACCNGDDCTPRTVTECDSVQGSFAGQGLACDAGRCLTGACCSVAGECSTLRSHECAAEGGEFADTGTICTEGACDVGACCLGTECAVLARINCESAGGIFLGEASICVENACALGACCDGVTCTDEILTTCQNANHIYRGAGTSCADEDPSPCPCTTGLDCDDGVFCNGSERCTDGVCGPGPVPADDGIACTVDVCFEENDTVTHTPDNAACDDGNFCDGPEVCVAQAGCQEGAAPDCSDDGNPCTVNDRCVTSLNACDGDRETSAAAWAAFAGCMDGPGVTVAVECACSDFDRDEDVDLRDAARFLLQAVRP